MAAHHATLAFSRHGESQWSVGYRFTGWVDVDLSVKGVAVDLCGRVFSCRLVDVPERPTPRERPTIPGTANSLDSIASGLPREPHGLPGTSFGWSAAARRPSLTASAVGPCSRCQLCWRFQPRGVHPVYAAVTGPSRPTPSSKNQLGTWLFGPSGCGIRLSHCGGLTTSFPKLYPLEAGVDQDGWPAQRPRTGQAALLSLPSPAVG